MNRVPTKDFSKKRSDLILQIRWLLNEMGAIENSIKEGSLEEALSIAKKETEDNYWINIKS